MGWQSRVKVCPHDSSDIKLGRLNALFSRLGRWEIQSSHCVIILDTAGNCCVCCVFNQINENNLLNSEIKLIRWTYWSLITRINPWLDLFKARETICSVLYLILWGPSTNGFSELKLHEAITTKYLVQLTKIDEASFGNGLNIRVPAWDWIYLATNMSLSHTAVGPLPSCGVLHTWDESRISLKCSILDILEPLECWTEIVWY